MRKSTFIPEHGTYQYDQDILDVQMGRTRDDLSREVKERTDGMAIKGLSKLRKFELAAMVAEWETASRENEQYLQELQDRAERLEQELKMQLKMQREREASQPVTSQPVTGPTITVVVSVGRKLVMGEVIGTVTRPMSCTSKHLVMVRHLTDAGHPRVTLHSPKEVAA
jgi:hypothetical protein